MLPGSVATNPGFTSVASLANPTCTPAACDVIEGILTNLPFLAIAGDVILLEPNGSISDVVRFLNNVLDTGAGTGLGTQVFMFSKIDSGPDLSAGPDLGLPSSFSANAVRIAEAPEGLPTIYNGNGTVYSFYSDSPVPEPPTLASVGTVLFGLGIPLLRRRYLAWRNSRPY
jgi:hypothetical protein